MQDLICRAWVIPEKQMIKDDWDFTIALINYSDHKDPEGNHTEIGFLKKCEGKIADVQLYSSKKDMNGVPVCDGDIIYSQKFLTYFKVVFDGCAFILVGRDDADAGFLSSLESNEIVIGGNIYEGMQKN
jgi:hypothetical protein